MSYEIKARKQIAEWEQKFLKPPGFLERSSNKLSHKINQWIPQKIHNAITIAVKSIVRTTLFGAEYTPKGKAQTELSLEEADEKALETLSLFQKIAAAEGAGTGAGGILLSAVDFPALIAIKMKFLFELAHVYGFNTKDFSERIFILTTFQLAFSGENQRGIILQSIKDWDDHKQAWSTDTAYYKDMNWETFQQDYSAVHSRYRGYSRCLG